MARARNIKPGFFKNEHLAEAPFEARLLFIGLWTLADREGRLEDRPKRIKMEIFPADNVAVDNLLDVLDKLGFICRYTIEGADYIEITAFIKHQLPHVREAASTIPAPTKASARHNLGKCEAQPRSPESPLLNPSSLNPESPFSESPAPIKPYPDWLPAKLWEAFKKHRGKKFTQHAQDLTIKKLTTFHEQGQNVQTILEASIANGWKGIFPEQQKGQSHGADTKSADRKRAYEELTGKSGQPIEGVSTRID